MSTHFNKFLMIASAVLIAACASTPDVRVGSADFVKASNGILVSSYGKTLYVFDKDSANSGKSECVAACATNWPPLYIEAGAKLSGDFSVVTRNDGQKQLAYKGKPLYFWSKDANPGDKTGDGFNNVWHVIQM